MELPVFLCKHFIIFLESRTLRRTGLGAKEVAIMSQKRFEIMTFVLEFACEI